MNRSAAASLTDLTGRSFTTAIRWLERAGFGFYDATEDGLREFRHSDGSVLWMRSTGEIVRLGPDRARYDQWGNKTNSRNTGERVTL